MPPLKGPSACLHPSTSNSAWGLQGWCFWGSGPWGWGGSQGRAKSHRSCFLEDGEATVEVQGLRRNVCLGCPPSPCGGRGLPDYRRALAASVGSILATLAA